MTQQRLLGIDISKWQSISLQQYKKLSNSNIAFCFIKATEGTNYISTSFKEQYINIGRNTGALRGAYHWYKPNENPQLQAKHFINTVKPLTQIGDLPPVIDVEDNKNLLITPEQLEANLLIYVNEIEKAFNTKPIIYTNGSYWIPYLKNSNKFKSYPLWLAGYPDETNAVKETYLPNLYPYKPFGGWTTTQKQLNLTFWQFTGNGTVAGIHPIDRNYFFGSEQELFKQANIPLGIDLKTTPLNYDKLFAIQQRLTELGYNTKGIDGIWGNNTNTAYENWQKDNNLPITKTLTPSSWIKLFNINQI